MTTKEAIDMAVNALRDAAADTESMAVEVSPSAPGVPDRRAKAAKMREAVKALEEFKAVRVVIYHSDGKYFGKYFSVQASYPVDAEVYQPDCGQKELYEEYQRLPFGCVVR